MPRRETISDPQPFLHLLRAAERWPDRPALISADRTLSFYELAIHAGRMAAVLARRGVRAGDLVAVATTNDLAVIFMESLFALGAVGAIVPGPLSSVEAVHFDWLITGTDVAVAPTTGVILVDHALFDEAGSLEEPFDVVPYAEMSSLCRILFSSGTTGRPAAVPVSIDIAEARARLYDRTWLTTQPFMTLIPLVGGIGFNVAYASMANGDTYFSPGSPDENLELIRANLIAALHASPAQLALLAAAAAAAGGGLESLHVIYAAGSVVPPPLVAALGEVTDAEIISTFGSTEAGGVMQGPLVDGVVRFEPPIDGIELSVVDEDGVPLEAGRVGRLRISSPCLPDGYLPGTGDDAAFRDGWFFSGDLAELRSDGSAILHGRADEVLNVGGVKLDPTSIAQALVDECGVDEAAVVSLSDADGEKVIVAVVADDGLDMDRVGAVFQHHAQGRQLDAVFLMEQLPRNEMGKVVPRMVVERYRAALAADDGPTMTP